MSFDVHESLHGGRRIDYSQPKGPKFDLKKFDKQINELVKEKKFDAAFENLQSQKANLSPTDYKVLKARISLGKAFHYKNYDGVLNILNNLRNDPELSNYFKKNPKERQQINNLISHVQKLKSVAPILALINGKIMNKDFLGVLTLINIPNYRQKLEAALGKDYCKYLELYAQVQMALQGRDFKTASYLLSTENNGALFIKYTPKGKEFISIIKAYEIADKILKYVDKKEYAAAQQLFLDKKSLLINYLSPGDYENLRRRTYADTVLETEGLRMKELTFSFPPLQPELDLAHLNEEFKIEILSNYLG